MTELQGQDFVALRRLSDADDRTIAAVGATCERVPAGRLGGTVSDALEKLLASGKIAPVAMPQTKADRSDALPLEAVDPEPTPKKKGKV